MIWVSTSCIVNLKYKQHKKVWSFLSNMVSTDNFFVIIFWSKIWMTLTRDQKFRMKFSFTTHALISLLTCTHPSRSQQLEKRWDFSQEKLPQKKNYQPLPEAHPLWDELNPDFLQRGVLQIPHQRKWTTRVINRRIRIVFPWQPGYVLFVWEGQ